MYGKHQNSTVFNINRENLALRLLQNHDRTNQALIDLQESLRSRKIVGITSEAVQELKDYYWQDYYSVVKQITMTTSTFSSMTESLSGWTQKSEHIEQQIDLMARVALTNTLTAA